MPKSRNRRKGRKTRKRAARRTSRRSDVRPPPFRSIESLLAAMGSDPSEADSPRDRAQALVYQAWEMPRARDREKLAREALELWPDCADALLILAEETAQSVEEAEALYRQAVTAGEQALGEQPFTEDVGHFWGLIETRPYMRARQALARVLETTGRTDEAIDHYRDMLRLNPGDNQGIRFFLLKLLIDLERNEDAGRLLDQFSEDIMAEWRYGRALLLFRQQGDSPAAREALSVALEANPHVPDYLRGRRKLPVPIPDYIGVGDKREAQAYAAIYKAIWHRDQAAVDWLKRQDTARAP